MKIQAGKLVVKDGRAACDCCGDLPPDELPPWVPDPDDPIWGGGPSGPVPPSGGTPRCCGGNTICSPVNTQPLLLRYFVAGEISAEYSYATGPNAGQVFSYNGDWEELFDDSSSGCDIGDNAAIEIEVPYVSSNGNPNSPVLRPINISISRMRWNRERGFFGDNADDPMFAPFSGIRYTVDNIRGHVNAGHTLVYQFCRSAVPFIPITAAVDKADWVRQPFTTIETREPGTTTPTGVCLNQVIADYTDSYTDTTSGGTTTIDVTMRIYAFVSGLTPCLTV